MKKICFDNRYGLTEAVIDGRKTMTRRIAYDKPMAYQARFGWENGHKILLDGWERVAVSKYAIGEVLAVAQSYYDIYEERVKAHGGSFCQWAKAKGLDYGRAIEEMEALQKESGYWNKLFVRSSLMPYQIKITGIGCERLQDITEYHCMCEGIYAHTVELDETPGIKPYTSYAYDCRKGSNIKRWWFETPQIAFSKLIDKTCGKGTWNKNPWVWVYQFELIK